MRHQRENAVIVLGILVIVVLLFYALTCAPLWFQAVFDIPLICGGR